MPRKRRGLNAGAVLPDCGPYLRGEKQLGEDGAGELLGEVREAMDRLGPRERRFLEMDMIDGFPPGRIEIEMGLVPGSFKKVKRVTMAALRDQILKGY